MKHVATLRHFVLAVSLTALSGCSGNQPHPTPIGPEARLRQVVNTLVALRSEEPTLPGVAYSDSLTTVMLADRSPADSALLIGRTYYDLQLRMNDVPAEQSSAASLRTLLSSPPRRGQITRAHADRLLSETKTRASTDPRFYLDVQQASQLAVTWSSSGGCKDSQGYNVPVLECMNPTIFLLCEWSW
jgi:hypothetical protein